MCRIAICIPTYNREPLVRDFLENCAAYYIDAGIDIYYYDSSAGTQTEECVRPWEGSGHIHYIRMPTEVRLSEKMLRIFQGYGREKEYDFISMTNDATQYSAKTLRLILENVDTKYDFIVYDNDPTAKTACFTVPDEFLRCCCEGSIHLGSSMVNVHTMLDGVDWEAYRSVFLPDGDNADSISMGASFIFYHQRFLELNSFCAFYLKIDRLKISALKKESLYDHDVMRYVCEGWVGTFERLPDAYRSKWEACRKTASKYVVGTVYDFTLYRRQGQYALRDYLKYRSQWWKITAIPRYKLLAVALMPRIWLERQYKHRKKRNLMKLRRFCESHTRVLIYGAGNHGGVYGEYLDRQGLNYEGYCASKRRPEKNSFRGYPIRVFDELTGQLEETGFIVAMTERNAAQILPELIKKVGREHIFYDHFFDLDIRDELGYQAYSGM